MQIPSEKKDKNIPAILAKYEYIGLSVIILGLAIFIFVALYKDHIDGWLNLIYPHITAIEKLRLSLRGKNGSQLAYGREIRQEVSAYWLSVKSVPSLLIVRPAVSVKEF